jgi:hypothetical protein
MKIYSIIALLPIFLFSATSTTNAPVLSPVELETQRIEVETTRRVDTIKRIETGTKKNCENIRGGSGEIGCWQILPSTLEGMKKKHKIQVKGYSYEVQKEATMAEIKNHVIKGYTPEQTFKVWNSGNLRPCSRGTNRWGVRYDSCKYVKEAKEVYLKLI